MIRNIREMTSTTSLSFCLSSALSQQLRRLLCASCYASKTNKSSAPVEEFIPFISLKYFLRTVLIVILSTSYGLTGCSSTKNYAPVTSSSYDLVNKKKYYIVRQGDTLYSIGFRSRLGYQKLSAWNNISSPYHLKVGQRIKLVKPKKTQKIQQVRRKNRVILSERRSTSQKTPRVERSSSQKKSTNSYGNKKVLKFIWQWPIDGKVIKNFSKTGNSGIDIGAKLGQKVKSSASGKVVYSGSGIKAYGNLLIVKHNHLYLSAYANNRKLFVEEGQSVKSGQVIAEVGRVGGNKALLHFEIRKNGDSVNPLNYLPKK